MKRNKMSRPLPHPYERQTWDIAASNLAGVAWTNNPGILEESTMTELFVFDSCRFRVSQMFNTRKELVQIVRFPEDLSLDLRSACESWANNRGYAAISLEDYLYRIFRGISLDQALHVKSK